MSFKSLLSLTKPTKRPSTLNFLSSNHHHVSSNQTSICSTQCQRRLQCQRRIPFTRQKQHLFLLKGIHLPLCLLFPSHLNYCLYSSHCQVPLDLSPPLTFSPFQEKMLALHFTSGSFSSKRLDFGSKLIARSIPYSVSSHVFVNGVSILGLPTKFEFCYQLPNLGFSSFSKRLGFGSKLIARLMPYSASSDVFVNGFSIWGFPTKIESCYQLPKLGFAGSSKRLDFGTLNSLSSASSSDVSVNGVSKMGLPTKIESCYQLPKLGFVNSSKRLGFGSLNSLSSRSICSSNVSVNGFSILGLPKLGFAKKMISSKFGGHYRVFSSCDCEDDERLSDDDYDEGNRVKNLVIPHESSADPEEVGRVAKVIDELFALDRNMEAVLDECGINLTHDLVVDVLQRFKHARKPAFRFFCWAGQRPGFSHDSRTYNVMLTILGKARQFETMGSLLEEMGGKGVLTIESCMIAIKAYACGKERKKAVGVLDLMKKHGFKVGVDTINCLLDALAREKLAKEAQAFYDKLKSRFTPNLKTYSILLSGWCRVKNLMEAGRIWNEMIDQGFKPDVITHNIMLDGLLKVKKRSDAIKLFEVMKAKGPAPSVRSYTILIRDLCKHSKMTEAVAYFDEMLGSGCDPDAGVYTCLITGFGNLKKMDLVYSLLREMKEKGHHPDGKLYNALIKLMTSRRMPDDAVRIYKTMIQNGIQPTIHTYNMMMKSYLLAGNSEMGFAVWDEMVERGCCPDENSYTILIGGLIRQGRSEEACKYVEEMINKGMRVPQLDLNKFVSDFSRIGRPNILEELARKMRLSGKSEVSEIFARWSEMTQKRNALKRS